jgi:hypothetical protein
MSITSPNLDDRTWTQLVESARQRIRERCPGWTDLSPSDPGMVLVEVFAFLTEAMIYRINRVPEKAYIEFLRLLGVQRQSPSAARVRLRFSQTKPVGAEVVVPRSTEVTMKREGASGRTISFRTLVETRLTPDRPTGEVDALECESVEAERLGEGTGLPGLTLRLHKAPVIADSGERDPPDLVVAVEAGDEAVDRADRIEHGDRVFRRWQEVRYFSEADSSYCYVADRFSGTITFAPAVERLAEEAREVLPGPVGPVTAEAAAFALAAVPKAGREIRAWYRRGGGSAGNVGAGKLTVLKPAIPGLDVTNPEAAAGGLDEETMENALLRGPLELRALHRAVTATDYELLARAASGGVNRVRAVTKAALWAHAVPGTVQVLLVPNLPPSHDPNQAVTPELLAGLESDEILSQVRQSLDRRRPLGTRCEVTFAPMKAVRVKARVVVPPDADRAEMRRRVLGRLNRSISPVRLDASSPGWRFGEPLHVSHVYDVCLSEPRVRYVEQVVLSVDQAPASETTCIVRDPHQTRTWYAGAGDKLFRTMNDGEGWDLVRQFAGERVLLVRSHERQPGTLAVLTRGGESAAGEDHVYITQDAGEHWRLQWRPESGFTLRDLAWVRREDLDLLMIASNKGVYQVPVDGTPERVSIAGDESPAAYATAATIDARGATMVAVALEVLPETKGGVFLSREGGVSGTFQLLGGKSDAERRNDIRVLAFQQIGSTTRLWAGTEAIGNQPGDGCLSWDVDAAKPVESRRGAGWKSGSCRALAFWGKWALAATHHGGVVSLDAEQSGAAWSEKPPECGLPRISDRDDFEPLAGVAARSGDTVILACGRNGIFRSLDEGARYAYISPLTFTEKVTLPPNGLFCSLEHDVEVVHQSADGSIDVDEGDKRE